MLCFPALLPASLYARPVSIHGFTFRPYSLYAALDFVIILLDCIGLR